MNIKVLVVDDSLFMRRLIKDMLNSDPHIDVIDAIKGGKEAFKKVSVLKPDCITLDLAMPGWSGLTTLKHIMKECPTPCVIVSAHSKENADITMKCLKAGAVGFVLKPSGELSLDIDIIKGQLIAAVKASANIEVKRIRSIAARKPKRTRLKLAGTNKIIVIGASTGGPQALEEILTSLPDDFSIPIVVVQHVPSIIFTESLARHLDKICALDVKVAKQYEIIQDGKVYCAPSGYRVAVKRYGPSEAAFDLTEEKPGALSPSIDKAMESIADIYKENTIGVILTGMGEDGCRGMKAVIEAGGETIVQDESSLIFGMPQAVIEAGYARKVLSAGGISEAILECASTGV